MRIELPRSVERFGAINLGELQKVFELDSGLDDGKMRSSNIGIQRIPYQKLCDIYNNMAIVVPVKSERIKLVEGVLSGIPHPCQIIIVSNSPTAPVNRYQMEKNALYDFCAFAGKKAMIVHQKDPLISKILREVNYTSILDEKGQVRDGKAEGMLIAITLAYLTGKKYIGFVDADNYFPGSVEEYIREYASGFALSRSNYSMVRIAWSSKPKIVESKFFFKKWGRTSKRTNELLNELISYYTGYETEIIKTGNAGEHAISMDLAMNLDYSYGYSIEPYHYINLLEKFGGINKSPLPKVMKETVDVFQIESKNPHLHESGDKEHIDQMSYLAHQVIYHSPICPEPLKKKICKYTRSRKFHGPDEEPAKPHYFPALSTIDMKKYARLIAKTPYGQFIDKRIGEKA